jgi:hypothetical protein
MVGIVKFVRAGTIPSIVRAELDVRGSIIYDHLADFALL